MAVYKRNYQPYDGPVTDPRWRFTVLPRFAFMEAFDSKLFTVFFTLSFVPTLVATVFIYFFHHVESLLAFNANALRDLVPIDNKFFMTVLEFQTVLTFFITAYIGPTLVSPDLTNNALPLYLSRPFTRKEYVVGKLSVIVTLTSLITWVPSLWLFFFQSSMAGAAWMWDNLRVALAIILVSWTWILTTALVALALSAWVKWRPIAGGAMFGIFFAGAGFGEVVNDMLFRRPDPLWGSLLDLQLMMRIISHWLFDVQFYNPVPVWSAWAGLLAICGFALLLLGRKIRACEVVRG